MNILLVDEWGAGNSIRLANDIVPTGASVSILREFEFNVPLPKRAHLLPPVSLALDDRFAAIDRAVATVDPDVVLPMDEPTLFQIWDQKPSWLSRLQPKINLEWLDCYRDKEQMTKFAIARGVPVPETLSLEDSNRDHIVSKLETLGLPVVVKGASGTSGEQVRIANTKEEAIVAVNELHSLTNQLPTLQRYVDGPTYQVGGLFDQGRSLRFFVGEKTELLPLNTGPAIELVSRDAQELQAYTELVMSGLGFSGLAGLDFVRDKDGRFYFLEVNPRIWGSYGFARALGIDLFGPWYKYLKGESQSAVLQYPIGVRWAKMPEYLNADPRSRASILKRLCRPVAITSLAWRQPFLLLHQLRRILWELRN